VLVLKEWDPASKEYTGRSIRKRVNYVAKTKDMVFWQEQDVMKYGFQIIGLE